MTDKVLCYQCVGEPYLKNEIRCEGSESVCSYCGRRANAYNVSCVSKRIDQAFKDHYERTEACPDEQEVARLTERYEDYEWTRSGEPVVAAISDAAEIQECVARDIQRKLEHEYEELERSHKNFETEYAAESHYEKITFYSTPDLETLQRNPDFEHWETLWDTFVHSILYEQRFFNTKANKILHDVFDGLQDLFQRSHRELILNFGPSHRFRNSVYRARTFQDPADIQKAVCRPDLGLGPPPEHLSTSGRMNVEGIPVFYGSNQRDLAVIEARPIVGGYSISVEFEFVRDVRLLNLSALYSSRADGSIFDRSFRNRQLKSAFVKTLCDRLCVQISPFEVPSEYLPIQVVAEFLAAHRELRIDGILYPPIQDQKGSGQNIVLFHESSRVEEVEIPPDTSSIRATSGFRDDSGWEANDFGLKANESQIKHATTEKMEQEEESDASEFIQDNREPTLRVKLQSMQVHRIVRLRPEEVFDEPELVRYEFVSSAQSSDS